MATSFILKKSKSIIISLLFVFGLLSWQTPNAQAAIYPMPAPGNDLIGEIVTVRSGSQDTLLTIGNRYGIGMHEMLEANPQLHQTEYTASQYLGRGKKVIVPAQFILPSARKGIVINLAELRLYYFSPDSQYVYTYPVGLGRMEWRTPLGKTSVISKEVDPIWDVPASIHKYVLEETGKSLPKRVMPGPENPLGPYALHLGISGYLIHGTNQPWSIGKYVSSGCIRMHDEDVTELYHMVKVGTSVAIINRAEKAGWNNGRLYLEAQVPLEPASAVNPQLEAKAVVASRVKDGVVDWNKVNQVVHEHLGIPQQVGGKTSQFAMANENAHEQISTIRKQSWPPVQYNYINNPVDSRLEVVQVIDVTEDVEDIRDSTVVKSLISNLPGVVEVSYVESGN